MVFPYGKKLFSLFENKQTFTAKLTQCSPISTGSERVSADLPLIPSSAGMIGYGFLELCVSERRRFGL